AFSADCGLLGRGLEDEQGAEAVQVRLAFVKVAVEAFANPVRAWHILDERKRATPQDVFLWEPGVLVERGGTVDVVPRGSEQRQHRRRNVLEFEHDGQRVWRLDRTDGTVRLLARADHAFGRIDDPLIAHFDIARGQRRAIVK